MTTSRLTARLRARARARARALPLHAAGSLASSLRVRLLLTLVLAVLAALGTVALTARGATTAEFDRYVARQRQEMQSLAEQLAPRVGDRLVLLDSEGRVMADAAPAPGAEAIIRRHRDPAAPPLGADTVGFAADAHAVVGLAAAPPPGAGQSIVWIQAAAAPSDGATEHFFTAPMHTFQAELLPPPVTLSPEELFARSVNRTLAAAVVVSAAVALVLAYLLSRRILRPVDALTAAARRMEAGDLSQRVPFTGRDEIGQLGHAFNAMADSLSRQEQLRRHMVTDVAHELRTPLSNLRGYLEAMRDGVVEPSPPLLDSVYEEAMLLAHLVDDLQELALAEAGQLSLALEPIAVGDLAESAVRAGQPAAAAKGVSLGVRLDPALPAIHADAKRLGQVLRNLIANAVRHTPAGGRVTVEAETLAADSGPARVRLSVRDTGEGIAPEHLPYVFERFYRADASRARATGGAGIGLTIVKQLVEAHGGAVSVESTLGRGTTFHVTLPAPSSPLPESAHSAPRALALAGA